MRYFILQLIVLFSASRISLEVRHQAIIWNVGQGLWLTFVSQDSCTHIDMGGEKAPWKKIISQCQGKQLNEVFFSHWDNDHINFLSRTARALPHFCVARFPAGPSTPQKRADFMKIRECKGKIFEARFKPHIKKRSTSNDFSRVFVKENLLMPGDSTKLQEKIWISQIPSAAVKFLVLGHHGSKTSTSDETLTRLRSLKLAIASARKKRYGHPHKDVLNKLKKRGVAALSTEHWNNIVIELED